MNGALLMTGLFALGIAAAGRLPFTLIFGAASLNLFLAYAFRNTRAQSLVLTFAVVCAGASSAQSSRYLPADHIARLRNAGRAVAVKGWAADSFSSQDRSFILQVEEIFFPTVRRNCLGRVLVQCRGGCACAYGDELLVEGQLLPVSKKFAAGGVSFRMSLPSRYFIRPTGRKRGGRIHGWLLDLRCRLRCRLGQALSPPAAAVLEAMVLGEKSGISPVLYSEMIRTGTVHVLVVSGTNVAIVYCIVSQLLKILRVGRLPRFYISALLLVLYCFLTGASNPVVRATVMALVLAIAFLIRREPDASTACCLSLLFILFLDPLQLFDIGFQLSYASVFAIILLYPRMRDGCRKLLPPGPLFSAAQGVLVSFSAWLGTAPFILYHFRTFSPVGVLANIFIVPLAGFLMLSGFSLMLFQQVAPFSAGLFSGAIETGVFALVRITEMFYRLPWSCISMRSAVSTPG